MKNLMMMVLFFLLSTSLFAKTINLYDAPKNDGKVIGSIDSEAGIVPIFTVKEGDWIKVGDPRNGNVGWIKATELNDASSGFTFRVINTGSGPNSYQIVQFGTPQKISSEQAKKVIQDMELRQKEFQKNLQQMMDGMFKQKDFGWPNFPVIVPVFMVPQEGKSTKTSPSQIKTQPTPNATQPAVPPTNTKQ